MADQDFTFEVTVTVSNWPDQVPSYPGGPDRTAADYARAALSMAGLHAASSLDGFADLPPMFGADGLTGPFARITDVDPL